MFRLYMFYTGRFTGSGSVGPPAGLLQMVDTLQRLGDSGG